MIGHLTEAAFVRSYGGKWITKDGKKVFVKDTTFGFHGGTGADSAGGDAPAAEGKGAASREMPDPTSPEGHMAYIAAAFPGFAAGLSADQKEAIWTYKDYGYNSINSQLRGVETYLKPEGVAKVAATSKTLESAFGETKLPAPLTVYRGATFRAPHMPEDPSEWLGATISDPAFLSTTTFPDKGVRYAGKIATKEYRGVVCEINLPAGHDVLPLQATRKMDQEPVPGEGELLLRPGQRFKITHVAEEGDLYRVKMEPVDE